MTIIMLDALNLRVRHTDGGQIGLFFDTEELERIAFDDALDN